MGKILGLDLGSASVGWAVMEVDENNHEIKTLGSRIIPLSTDDAKEFTSGNAITKNADRTARRTQRKGYDRYQLRRKVLTDFLRQHAMAPDETMINLTALELWGLRARGVTEQLTPSELGRVLYHLSQKRGYKSAKDDADDAKQRDYVKLVLGRHDTIRQAGQTIGQYFFEALNQDQFYRTKEQVFPRKAYVEEFDAIIATQRRFNPQLFTDQEVEQLRDRIIYYQRPLKSCKHLVSLCEFEKRSYKNDQGQLVENGPKVAPRSSPLAQVCKIWESIDNVVLKNRTGVAFGVTPEHRQAMANHLYLNERLTMTDLYKILGIKRSDGWWGGKSVGAKNMGDTTRLILAKALEGQHADLLRFDLQVEQVADRVTGELRQMISDRFQNEPLYRLWHTVYSIKEHDELAAALEKQFGITDPKVVENLFAIDFTKAGYANKSAKAMRRILPYLQEGQMYDKACVAAGFRHSESLTNQEQAQRALLPQIELLKKGELRQPIVEKILNQMINVVNALMDKYGQFDEIRVELARELKQSTDERYQTTLNISKATKENSAIAERIQTEYGLTPTRSRIQKFKMWREAEEHCFYCGTNVGVREFLRGFEVEVEHVIPKSLFFDDGFSNKVCACRTCNAEKNNRTAYDYMKSKPDQVLQDYLDRIERYYKEKRISKTKYERLLTPEAEIPTDFIDRQLRESQYIARKSREILSQVCRNVTATSGMVTDFVRKTWGWDTILEQLNFERYQAAGLTQTVVSEHRGSSQERQKIIGWSKREDHRHHAIDALVIASTTQAMIHRLNNLATLKNESFSPFENQGEAFREKQTQLERYLNSVPHPSRATVCAAVEQILISFKAGKKAATLGKRYVHKGRKRILMQDRVVVPRGPLSEESVYGQRVVRELNKKGQEVLRNEYVIKYPVGVNFDKVAKVIDLGVKRILEARLAKFNNNPKQAFKAVETESGKMVPWYTDEGLVRPILSVRCTTGLSAVVPVRYNEQGDPTGFVKPGNNHHVAIYIDKAGKRQELVTTFWHAVERVKYDLPVVITNPEAEWDKISDKNLPASFLEQLPDPTWVFELSMQQNEMFIIGLSNEAFDEAIRTNDRKLLSKHLYRVQKLATMDCVFRLHLETKTDDKFGEVVNSNLSMQMGKMHRVSSLGRLVALNCKKVKITLLGEIIVKE